MIILINIIKCLEKNIMEYQNEILNITNDFWNTHPNIFANLSYGGALHIYLKSIYCYLTNKYVNFRIKTKLFYYNSNQK